MSETSSMLQEPPVSFDPVESEWFSAIVSAICILVLLGIWRVIFWILRRHRAAIPWQTLRWAWPLATTATGSCLIWISVLEGPLGAAPFAVVILINPLGLLIAGALIAFVNGPKPLWPMLAGGAGFALGAYVMARFVERRVCGNDSPLTLGMRDADP